MSLDLLLGLCGGAIIWFGLTFMDLMWPIRGPRTARGVVRPLARRRPKVLQKKVDPITDLVTWKRARRREDSAAWEEMWKQLAPGEYHQWSGKRWVKKGDPHDEDHVIERINVLNADGEIVTSYKTHRHSTP